MHLCWIIIYISVFVMLVFLIPLAIFYYESDDEKPIVKIHIIKVSKNNLNLNLRIYGPCIYFLNNFLNLFLVKRCFSACYCISIRCCTIILIEWNWFTNWYIYNNWRKIRSYNYNNWSNHIYYRIDVFSRIFLLNFIWRNRNGCFTFRSCLFIWN